MAAVPGVLLDHVHHDPAQVRMMVATGPRRQVVERPALDGLTGDRDLASEHGGRAQPWNARPVKESTVVNDSTGSRLSLVG